MLVNIIVDDEFKKLIPPLTAEERKGLEESILKEGCRDALILWGNILIDGHNRYEICTKHNIPFKTIQKDFKSRDEVILYMIDTQFSRRNLSSGNKILLAQAKKPILEKLARAKQAEYHGNQYEKCTVVNNDKSANEEKLSYKKPEIIEPPKTTAVSILPKKTNRNNSSHKQKDYQKSVCVNSHKAIIEEPKIDVKKELAKRIGTGEQSIHGD